MDLKDRLRSARKAKGLTQQQLADAVDLSLKLLVMLEGGHRTNMQATTALKLAHELGCTVDWLLQGTDAAPTPDDGKAA